MLNFRKNLLHSHRNSHSLSVRLKHRYVDLQTELWDSSVQWLEHHNMACFATCIGSTKPVLPVLLTVKFRGERSWWATVHEAAELDATEHTHTHSSFTNVVFSCMTYHFIKPLEISWCLEAIIYVFLELYGEITVIGLSTSEKEMIHMS